MVSHQVDDGHCFSGLGKGEAPPTSKGISDFIIENPEESQKVRGNKIQLRTGCIS